MDTRVENWLGHEIRFVEKNPGVWWAVLADIAKALKLRTDKIASRLEDDHLSRVAIKDSIDREQEMLVVDEYGVYEAVFESRKKEAKEFKCWIFEIIKTLRQASGLEGFQIFRMLDKEHQREAMAKLSAGLTKPARVDFIKANTVTNKTVSTMHGYKKMVKKGDMSPEMLIDRQKVLDDTVNLMAINDSFKLGLPISQTIYDKFISAN